MAFSQNGRALRAGLFLSLSFPFSLSLSLSFSFLLIRRRPLLFSSSSFSSFSSSSPALSAVCVKQKRQGRRAAVLLSRQAPWYMLLCPGVFWWEQLSRSPSLPPYLPTYLLLGLHSSLSIPLSLSLSRSLSLPLSLSMYISALENPEAMHERLDTTVVDFFAKQDSRTVLERCCWEPNLGMLHRCAHAQDETQQASSWDAYRTLPNHT